MTCERGFKGMTETIISALTEQRDKKENGGEKVKNMDTATVLVIT
jgi:hypothetical protein